MPASERAKKHIRLFRDRQSGRSVWNEHWDDLVRVMLPRRLGFASAPVSGERRTDDLYDGTPQQAARGLANAIGGMLRPEGQKFFFLKTGENEDEKTGEAKEWLADTEERMDDAFKNPKARFRQATGECDLDLVVLGTGCIFEGEGRELNHLLFQSVHLKDAFPGVDADGAVNSMYRQRTLTVQQAVDEFSLANVSEDVRKKYRDEKYGDKTDYLHCVVRRDGGREDALLARNYPYTDLWIDMTAQEEVRDGGFRDFPFIFPRWDTSSGEDYGRSPGMIALPDANTLQAMGETILVAGQRAADPPLAAPFDGFMTEYNTFPGGLVHYDIETAQTIGRIPVQPIESGTNLPITRDMQSDLRDQIFRAFLKNILNLPIEGPQMTATEVMQRKEEFLREIGPVFGRLETDYTAPLVERAFRVMFRAGVFAPVPPALLGRSVRFEYESPVKRIRQQIEARAAELWAGQQVELSVKTGRPEILDNVDFDELARFTHEAAALPGRILKGADKVAAIRQHRQEQQQQAAQVAAAQQIAEGAGKAAPALKVLQGGQAA